MMHLLSKQTYSTVLPGEVGLQQVSRAAGYVVRYLEWAPRRFLILPRKKTAKEQPAPTP